MILRMTTHDGWDLGPNIAEHLIEVDASGTVLRLIDLDKQGRIVDAAPTEANTHGAVDHAPLDMNSDWSDNAYSRDQFEMLWAKTKK